MKLSAAPKKPGSTSSCGVSKRNSPKQFIPAAPLKAGQGVSAKVNKTVGTILWNAILSRQSGSEFQFDGPPKRQTRHPLPW